MSLRLTAESDLNEILNDSTEGFGWEITLLDPSGEPHTLKTLTNDIAQVIDPETGEVVSGRNATVAVSIRDLKCLGLTMPYGVVDSSQKPWVVKFKDIQDIEYTFKVYKSDPDRSIGLLMLYLETYRQ